MKTDTRQQIETALRAFSGADLRTASIELLDSLGYQSEKTLDLDNTRDAFLAEFDKRDREFRKDKALFDYWKSVEFLFQITDDEVRNAGAQGTLFDSGYDPGKYQSYLFFAIDLEKNHYTRAHLADITREINLLFDMPAMLLIRHNGALTFSVIDRRLHKKDQSRDVLKKVKLIKDIRYQNPHRAHIEILHDLALPELMAKHECRDFKQLHEAWRTTLDTNELNKKFYRELAGWYFWALDNVEFPADVEKDEATRNATNVIRLLTRLIFCWFLKEKGLIPANLFSERKLAGVLKSLKDDDGTFYQAILQNLFFGTLNQRMNTGDRENRKFTSDGPHHERMNEYGVKNLYRYQKMFAVSEEEAVNLFSDIPFMNGGLFDCLDKEDKSGKVIYVDGFTRKSSKQPKVPNFLFFSDYRTLDLSKATGDKKRKKEKVRGLINLLDSYKFTVTENTPIEEEIALDPELLGKVFENLLASYNPETGTTARKQTGSFYTPREIVNYMVDESLITYLESQLKAKVPKLAGMKDLQDLLREVFAYTEKVHPFDEEEIEALIDAIDTCKILDPACGSGAFPMGILHKLVFILGKIDPHNERWKQKQLDKLDSVSMRDELERTFRDNDDDYGRKLYLIENCIYGVDIQPIAIQISKLRFFISLICDQRTNNNKARNCGVRPLPNLETKFVAANTLISLDRGQDQLLLTDERLPKLERELASVRHKHFAAQRRRDKLALQRRDAELRKEISVILESGGMSGEASHQLAAWNPYDQNTKATFFDPEWMFSFTGGFDIAIANPPYVRQETIRKQKALLKKEFGDFFASTADLFTYFYRKAFAVLNDSGHLCFISPNKFFRAGYGKNLRYDLAKNKTIRILIDFGELPVFDAGTDPAIVIAGNHKPKDNAITAVLIKYKEQIADVRATVQKEGFTIPQDALSPEGWTLESGSTLDLLKKLKETGTPLSRFVERRFYRGILTGLNDAFVIDDATRKALIAEDPGSAKVIQTWLRGKDIKRWYADWQLLYVINIQSSANKAWPWSHVAPDDEDKAERIFKREFPAIFRHLKKWKTQLKNRDDQGRFYWELRSCAYSDEFTLPKLVYNETSKELHCLYDEEGLTINKTGFILLCDTPKCLLGILNARLLDYFYRHEFPAWGDPWAGGRVQFRGDRMGAVRIPFIRPDDKNAIECLVDKAINAKRDDPTADISKIEAEIDQIVYKLYDLTSDEIAIVESK